MISTNQLASSMGFIHTIILIYMSLLLLMTVDAASHRPFPKGSPTGRGDEFLVKLRMNGALPKEDGDRVCQGFVLQKGDDFWAKEFSAQVIKYTPHHLGLYACDYIPPDGSSCSCPLGNRTLVYSWIRFTPPHRLPPDMGIHIGGDSESQFLFLQLHYGKKFDIVGGDKYTGVDLHLTRKKQKYVAGYYSSMGIGTIPPHRKDFTLENCFEVDRKVPFHIFAYQPHGHFMLPIMSVYRISKKSGELAEIGRGNPLFPEAHYPASRIVDVEPGDTIISRCLYDSRNQTSPTNTNGLPGIPGAPMEMCNFHMIYYADSSINTKGHYMSGNCTEKQVASLPKSSMEPLPPNDLLMDHAVNGNQKGVIRINENITMNMEMENFESLFGPYSKKEKKKTAFIGKH